jgi:hypothetical protein
VGARDVRYPRISAYGIHKCIYAQMSFIDQEMTIVQLDGPKRILSSFGTMDVVHSTGGKIPTYQRRNISSPDACS